MRKTFTLQNLLIMLFIFTATAGFARDYIIYSISQEVPMGTDNETVKKNYYVNMGNKQGLKNGTNLDVFRLISILDPYKSKKRYNYRVKIGELMVIHSEASSSITALKTMIDTPESPLLEIDSFMIGDQVGVSVNN